jgi:hypothetical protein
MSRKQQQQSINVALTVNVDGGVVCCPWRMVVNRRKEASQKLIDKCGGEAFSRSA